MGVLFICKFIFANFFSFFPTYLYVVAFIMLHICSTWHFGANLLLNMNCLVFFLTDVLKITEDCFYVWTLGFVLPTWTLQTEENHENELFEITKNLHKTSIQTHNSMQNWKVVSTYTKKNYQIFGVKDNYLGNTSNSIFSYYT